MDGKIVISTELDTKQLEKQLKDQQKELQKYNEEAEKLTKQRANIDTSIAMKQVDELNTKLKEAQEKLKEMGTGVGYGYAFGKQKDLVDDLKIKLEETKQKYRDQLGEVEKINLSLQRNKNNQGLIKDKIKQTTNAIKEQKNAEKEVEGGTFSIGEGFNKVIKKVGKLTLAIFGIRSAYMLVRRAMDTITQGDEQLKADVDYMKNAFAYTLEPVIRQIVGLVQTLMRYIQYIIYKWTGKNIFANANKSLKSATGQAKELKKTLMGFDEINMLQSSSSSGGGTATPSFDLSNVMDESAMPKWIQWIADNKKLIEDLAITALGIFGTLTIANWIKNIGGFLGSSQLGALGTKLTNLGLIAGGIIITAICAQKVWEDTQELKKELGIISENLEDNTKKWIDTEPPIKQVYDTIAVRQNATNDLIKEYHSWWWKIFGVSDEILKNLKAGVKGEKLLIDKAMDEYDVEKATNEERNKMIKTLETQIERNNDVIKLLKEQGQDTKDLENDNKELAGYLYSVRNNIKYNKDETSKWATETGKVKTNFDGTVELLDTIDSKDLKDKKVNITADTSSYDKDVKEIKNANNETKVKVKADTTGFLSSLKTSLSSAFANLSTAGKNASSSIAKLFGIKLASGGIINMPGKGVPLGYSAIGGEAGKEGVVPLTDPTAMAQLGEEIGKWVNIGIQNQMVVDGRVLATATNNRVNKENFLMNR